MTDKALLKHAALPYEAVAVDAADILTVYYGVMQGLATEDVIQAIARMRGALPSTYPANPVRERLAAVLREHSGTEPVSNKLLDALLAAVSA